MKTSEPGSGGTRASLELLYHVSREFASALELRAVLERVLFLSMKTVRAQSGSIVVFDDNGKPVESAIITGSKVHKHTTPRLKVTVERGLAGWVYQRREAVLVTDTTQDERWLPSQQDSKEHPHTRSAVSAPLLLREKPVGVMTLAHTSPNFFNEEHLALVQAIADQAGIAVLNARLYAESQRQARVMTALAESAAAINASLKLEDVLVRILDQIIQALRVQAVSLALIDFKTGELVFRATNGWNAGAPGKARLKLGRGVAGWVAREGQGAVVPDVRVDPRSDPEIDLRTGLNVSGVICAPVRYRGQVMGVLEALNPEDDLFDPDALFVLTGIGSLAGTAIQHAQLFENLQVAHQRYRDLFEDSIDPILLTNLQGRILEANRQAVLNSGYGKLKLRDMSISEVHHLNQAKTGQRFEKVQNGKTLTYESELCTEDGNKIPIQVYVRRVNIDYIPHLQWILRDITERKNLDSLREDLLSMIYHDLRSPLGNVLSSLETVEMFLPEDEDPTLASLIRIAIRSTERIQRLTNSLLDINRLEAGQPVGNRQKTSVEAIINDAIEAVLPILQNKGHELHQTVAADLPELACDGDMIRRVLINLLENAIKFTPMKGYVEISCQQDGEYILFGVRDTGPGIPASEHEFIFEKFKRLSERNTGKGLGLGLTYCRLAVEAHGGRIWVESQPGAGAYFAFTLPIESSETSIANQ